MLTHLQLAEYIVEWIIRIGALLVVPQRRAPAATRAWLLMIFFLPIPGLLLFLAIGSPRFPAWRKARFEALSPFFAEAAAAMSAHPARLGSIEPIADLATTLGRLPATGGNHIQLIDRYDDVFDALVSEQPYKHAWEIDAALAHLYAQRGRLFDPQCVQVLVSARRQLEALCDRHRASQGEAP